MTDETLTEYPVPTEPGYYTDCDGDEWRLDPDGTWYLNNAWTFDEEYDEDEDAQWEAIEPDNEDQPQPSEYGPLTKVTK